MSDVTQLSVPLSRAMAEAVAVLHAACFARAWAPDEISAIAAMPGAFAAIARESEAPSGFVLGRIAADEAEIVSLGVKPIYRRRGIGQALLRHTTDFLRAEGVTVLYIEVAEGNTGAQALYGKAGFMEAGRRAAYYQENGQDAIVMRCRLTSLDADAVDI